MTDSDLLRRYVEEGHDDAFTELVSRRVNLVYGSALRQLGGDVHRARDVAQTVFIDLAQKAPALVRHPSLIAWLYSSTRYAALNIIRLERRRRQRELDAHLMQYVLLDSVPDADWDHVRSGLDDAIHRLGERDRRIVLLRFFDRQTYAAIAAELGSTENAVQKRAGRALAQLQALLGRQGCKSTLVALETLLAKESLMAAPRGMVTEMADVALNAAASGSAVSHLPLTLKLIAAAHAPLLAGITLVLALGAGVYQSTRHNRSSSSSAAKPGVAQAPRGADATVRDVEAGASLAAPTVTMEVRPATAAAGSDAFSPRIARQLAARDAALIADSHLRELLLERSRLNICLNYAGWFRRQHWTDARIETFADFVFDYARQLPPAPNYQPEPDMEADQVFAAAMRSRFGTAVADSFTAYQKTIIERRMVETLYAELYDPEHLLTAAQMDALMEILAKAHAPSHRFVPQVYAERPVSRPNLPVGMRWLGIYLGGIDWSVVLSSANEILLPSQMAGMRGLAAHVRLARALLQAEGEARRGQATNASGGAPSPETIIARDRAGFAEYCRDFRTALDFDDASAWRAANLTDVQIERLKDARVIELQRAIALRTARETGRISKGDWQVLQRAAAARSSAAEAEILGAAGQRYRDFVRVAKAREKVGRLAACEAFGDAPLSAAQIEAAAKILIAHCSSAGGDGWPDVDWGGATPELAPLLAPAQIALVKGFCRMSQLDHEVQQEIQRVLDSFVADAAPSSVEPATPDSTGRTP